ncbi:MAG: hypothetical protein JRI68_09680, partial [Deltaproteobacteria bacterium]|nr:hypothetical protein [Deltaproteobacteria bacterium]
MQGSEEGKGIAAFWAWWPSAAPAFDQALQAGSLSGWLAEGAKPDEVWEYHPARQPRADGPRELSLGGKQLQLAELTACWSVDRAREVLSVTLHHTQFDELDATHRAHAAFVALDDLLGEDGVELWLGNVELATQPPSQAHPLAELRQAVSDLEQEATGEHWVSRQGDIDGSPMVVTVNRALKAVRHLTLDQHARIDIVLEDPNKLGLARGDEVLELEKRE